MKRSTTDPVTKSAIKMLIKDKSTDYVCDRNDVYASCVQASFTFTMNESTAQMLVERVSPLNPEMDMNAMGNRILERYASLLEEGRNELLKHIHEENIDRITSILTDILMDKIGSTLEETHAIFEEVAKIVEQGDRGENSYCHDDSSNNKSNPGLAEKIRQLPYLARFVLIDCVEMAIAQREHEDLLNSDPAHIGLPFSRFTTRIPSMLRQVLN